MEYSKYTEQYYSKILSILKKVENNQTQLKQIAELLYTAITTGNNIFIFGASHAGIISEEMTYRAGGLALFNPIFSDALMLNSVPVTKTTAAEGIADLGELMIDHSRLTKDDVIFIHSVSGRNPLTIEAALKAKAKGAKVLALTSMETAKQIKSKHESGLLLHEVADITLDNFGVYGDGCVEIEGMVQKVAPTSTIASAIIMHSIVILFCEIWLERNSDKLVPVYASANVDGNGDINQLIMSKFKDHIFYL